MPFFGLSGLPPCYGVGALIGGLLALGRRPRRPLLVATLATLGFPLPPLTLAMHLPAAAVAGGALLAGLGSALGGAISTTVTQQRLPAGVLSRVGSFNLVGAYALGPIAFIAAGPAAAAVGARTVLGFGAAWAVFGTLAVLAAPSIRNLTWREAPLPEAVEPEASSPAPPSLRRQPLGAIPPPPPTTRGERVAARRVPGKDSAEN